MSMAIAGIRGAPRRKVRGVHAEVSCGGRACLLHTRKTMGSGAARWWEVRPILKRVILTAAEFGSLASGYGDRSAVAKLAAGQLAKRQLLMYALARQASLMGGAIGRTVAGAVSLLVEAEARAPEVLQTLLRHPQVDAWAAGCMRMLDRRDEGSLV